jgi:hypothetical protein
MNLKYIKQLDLEKDNMSKTKEVAKAANTEVSAEVLNLGSFGTENVINSDLRLPKILLAQSMSESVKERKCFAGDIVESFEFAKLGDDKSPVKIIPFYMTNTWTIKKEVNGKMEFEKVEDRGGNDIKREYEVIGSDGIKRTNHRTMNIFCLIKGGDLKVPYMISLQNASFKHAAQPYLNKQALLKTTNKSPAHIVFELGVVEEKNDKGTWNAFKLEASKNADGKDIANTNEEILAAFAQYKALTGSLAAGAKIDMSDAADTSVEEATNVKY